jgi:hypothetical protein
MFSIRGRGEGKELLFFRIAGAVLGRNKRID